MKTVSSLSGGKTSSYMAVKYPSDVYVFALVKTDCRELLFPDKKIRQIVSDKINDDFIGTLEDDMIIYTMLDLEQKLGQNINWISGKSFDYIINKKKNYLPNQFASYCTVDMKIKPIAQWCYDNLELPIYMQIGYRTNEKSRAFNLLEREINGYENYKFRVGVKNNRNIWKELPYRKCTFPLMNDGIFKDNIIEYWKNDNSVRFANFNNCVGCFHQNPILLHHRSIESSKKFQWFAERERLNNYKNTFKNGVTYDKIASKKIQMQLFDYDFNECDSGYCGL